LRNGGDREVAMLFSVKSGEPKEMRETPQESLYESCKSRLTREQTNAIIAELESRIGEGGIRTSSWIPSQDWAGTVFEPILAAACEQDYKLAAEFFGIMVWEILKARPEAWGFKLDEKDGVPIEGMVYFRLPKKDKK
jgi:hypothetical protein